METNKIILIYLVLFIFEASVPNIINISNSIIKIGIVRILETSLIIIIFKFCHMNLDKIGIIPNKIIFGIKKGLLWSIAFGCIVIIGFILLYLFGINPFKLISGKIPETKFDILMLFIVGGIIAPIFEEIFFRGLIYGYIRQWSKILALLISSYIFAMQHYGFSQAPITQIIGGIIFAISYEIEKNLIVPITIHSLGNMAIFALSILISL
ncbi:MAG: CPBP family intramembrane metalloprotease [Desulfobacterales bacterium]|nr:CPBP family intramembrane metalloprotease [Desulfobacterales bacterium]MBF0395775.1 CPBP family intramembrane metalloprotease [Desulfobacterales bacterium]